MNEKKEFIPARQDVRLMVVHGDSTSENEEIKIDLGLIFRRCKRMALLWLCLAVGLGALTASLYVIYHRAQRPEEVKALVSFSSEILRSQDAAYEIAKMRSPTVVEDAVSRMGLEDYSLEDLRNAIKISGVISDRAFEQLTLYYNLVRDGSQNDNLLQILLNTDYDVSRYIITFSCEDAGLSAADGSVFLNTLLRSYQNFFNETYNHNIAMGSSITALSYQDYDYAEAANIFSNTLDTISSYLSNITGSEASQFRSTETGYTFSDLRQTASLLKEIDVDRITSYIVTHSVSSYDAKTEIDYYQWQIEELGRQRAVQRTRMDALTSSIAAYEKDPIIVAIREGDTMVSDTEEMYSNYDSMIQEKLSVLNAITSFNRSISYYESVVEGFRNATISYVENTLATLNQRINRLIQDTNATANEYYEKMAFADKIRVEIPAVAGHSPLHLSSLLKILFAAELLLMMLYFAAAAIKGIQDANPPRQKQL